jgi:hypothetical protein
MYERVRTDLIPGADNLSGLPLFGKVVDLGRELQQRPESTKSTTGFTFFTGSYLESQPLNFALGIDLVAVTSLFLCTSSIFIRINRCASRCSEALGDELSSCLFQAM